MIYEVVLIDLDKMEEGPAYEKIIKQKEIVDNVAKQMLELLKQI